MRDYSFARPVAVVPHDLMVKDFHALELTPDEHEHLIQAAGVAPGFPEVFANERARDAALGPFGSYVTFVPASWVEAEAGGFEVASIAIGHPISDPDFATVASPILDAIAHQIVDFHGLEVIVNRTRYIVCRGIDGTVKTRAWSTEFDGTPVETGVGIETAAYLDSELNRRLALRAV